MNSRPDQIQYARESLFHAINSSDEDLVVAVAEHLMWLLFLGSQPREIEAVYQTLPVKEKQDPNLLYWRAKGKLFLGEAKSALKMLESIEGKAEISSPSRQADVLIMQGDCLKDMGEALSSGKLPRLYDEAINIIESVSANPKLYWKDKLELLEIKGVAMINRGLFKQHLQRNYQSAFDDYIAAKSIFEDVQMYNQLPSIYYNLADLYRDPRSQDSYSLKKAFDAATDGLDIAEREQMPYRQAELLYLLAKLSEDKDRQAAINYLKRSRDLYAKSVGDDLSAAFAERHIVRLEVEGEMISKAQALESFKNPLGVFERFKSNAHAARSAVDTLLLCAALQLSQNNLEGASHALDEADRWVSSSTALRGHGSDRWRRLRVTLGRAIILNKQGNNDLALEMLLASDVKETLAAFNQAIDLDNPQQWEELFSRRYR